MLSADITVAVDLDLGDVFSALGRAMVDVDLGDVRFDAGAVLTLVAQAAPPDLTGVVGAADAAGTQLAGRVSVGLPGAGLPGEIDRLLTLLGGLDGIVPDVELPDDAGLDALLSQVTSVTGALETGPLSVLFGLLPSLDLSGALGRVGGTVGGLVDLARVLAGLTAISATSSRLVVGADVLGARLDVETATGAGRRLGELCADTGLVAAVRAVDPDDAAAVDALSVRLGAFLEAVLEVGDRWSLGMGTGEAALLGLDLTGRATALELARLSLDGADLDAVATLATSVRAAAAPLLSTPLPQPVEAGVDVLQQAFELLEGLTVTLRAWDPGTLVAPVSGVLGVATAPLEQARQGIETVAGTATSAIRALRDLVTEVDLGAVSTAVQVALQPVVDTLDAVEEAVGAAEAVITQVCQNIVGGLEAVADEVEQATATVRAGLDRARALLAELNLQDLADALRTELTQVAAVLAAAQLSPYFDTAVDVIDTGTEVIDAVPFGMLPTDVQQEIVDVARPIKTLDLDPVEATLLQTLQEIRSTLDDEALDAVRAAFDAVLDVLVSLDPEPFLVELEEGPLATLGEVVAGIDPEALLAPAQAALDSFRRLLAGVDLEAEVLTPLADLFDPVTQALASLDPAGAFGPVQEALDAVRARALAVLHLDEVTAAATLLRDRAVSGLARLDPASLVAVLDAEVAARLQALPPGPAGGAFGSVLVTLAHASGLDATEGAVADALTWTRVAGGSVPVAADGTPEPGGATAVRGRLEHVAAVLERVRTEVTSLDPVPLAAAATAQHRALTTALAVHPAGSLLRGRVDASFAGVVPSEVLGPLAENRRRYLAALTVAAGQAGTLAASGRSEVDTAAAGLAAALAPLQAFPAFARSLLAALGVEGSDAPLPDLVRALWALAGPARVLPALSEIVTVGRDKVVAALDALLAPVLATVDAVRAVVDGLDVGPVVEEIEALHATVVAEVAALSPETMLRPVLTQAQDVVDRVEAFDPLGAVRDVVDAAKQAADRVLEAARPTVVFAPAVDMHADVLALAQGLDVEALLRPVLDALAGLTVQLDDGFVRTTDALQRLQAALPDRVEESSVSASVSVGVSL
ncbi:hypothetical protein [Jannaschia sp. R86511]|uniref:hypothetical protein n=1 Tax=Jannaschia sp. R86511 TaxID=3093853 RepID=UPI0036D21C62